MAMQPGAGGDGTRQPEGGRKELPERKRRDRKEEEGRMSEDNRKNAAGQEIPASMIQQKEKRKKNQSASLNKMAFTSGFFFILAQLLARGFNFIVTPIYSRLLTKAQYGIVTTYESWLLIAYTVMSLCLWRSVDVAKHDFSDDYNGYVSSVHTLSYIAIAIFFGICMLFKEQVMAFCDMDDLMFYMLFLYVFTYTSMLYVQRRDKQVMKYKFSTAATVLTIIPGTVLSIALLYQGRIQGLVDQLVHRRIVGYYAPQIIGGALIAILIWWQGKKFVNLKYWKYGLAYSLPLIPEALSVQIMNQSDRIIIKKIVGDTAAGIFSLGMTVSYVIWILEDSVWNAWIPWLYEKIAREEANEVEKPWVIVMHMFGLLSWLLVALAPEEILILGGERYREAVWLIAPLVTGTLFRFFSYSYSAVQNYYKRTQYVAMGTIGAMILNLVISYIGIALFGYMAAAYMMAISYFVLLLLQGFLEHKITGMVIVPLGRTVKISFAYLAVNLATMGLYLLPWYARYAAILIVLLIGLKVFYPQMRAVLKMLKKK